MKLWPDAGDGNWAVDDPRNITVRLGPPPHVVIEHTPNGLIEIGEAVIKNKSCVFENDDKENGRLLIVQRYRRSCEIFRNKILKNWPDAHAVEDSNNDIAYSLWQMEQIQTMTNQRKIDRWIGNVHIALVRILKLYSWEKICDLTRQEIGKGASFKSVMFLLTDD